MCIPPSLTDQERTQKKQKNRREAVKFWAEIATLLIFFIYATFTILIWCANKRVAEDTHRSVVNADRNFRTDERAWMAFKFAEGSLTFTLGKSLAIIYLPNQSQRMTRQRWRVFILGIQQSRQQEGSRHDGQRFQMIPSNVAGRSGQRILDAFFLSSFA
jgi:hypothetical protein